ncbi:DUF6607 family protein [Sphingomonas canadensis]|uniref:DUF6607 family protein n=1 Tax=Sphingomonas canadensis TaxID=1219257 RepID=A0ABW3HE32_9SPHN|nr:DUF6607 family protein [Sphingomonas canadensis]MCW3837173.1 hypothetical protein [Sphingomonas canadensis]
MSWTLTAALSAAVLPPLALALALPAAPAAAQAPARQTASFETDRAGILAMAGNYKVRFDMQEATAWRGDYTPIDRKISGGYESVRVIEDSGRRIVLQHLLVVTIDGAAHVIKHWRQDWEYEPARVLGYDGQGAWTWKDVPEAQRKGAWSQTVWQVDDSPRYAGWGIWETVGGVRRWRSSWTWRPLARRDAVRGPVYDRYLSINRHQPTPTGWVHWQDNTKMGLFAGKLEPVVQEYVLNTYTRFDGYEVKAADDYWAATKGYWAAVRAEWDRVGAAKKGIRVAEEAQAGTVISARLLELADAVQAGKTAEAAAIAEARKLIDGATR